MIKIGQQVHVPHGKGGVVGYELLLNTGCTISTTPPPKGVNFRYVIKLEPGHTWAFNNALYGIFPDDVRVLED